jgi:hypothetical protein
MYNDLATLGMEILQEMRRSVSSQRLSNLAYPTNRMPYLTDRQKHANALLEAYVLSVILEAQEGGSVHDTDSTGSAWESTSSSGSDSALCACVLPWKQPAVLAEFQGGWDYQLVRYSGYYQ